MVFEHSILNLMNGIFLQTYHDQKSSGAQISDFMPRNEVIFTQHKGLRCHSN